MAYIYEITNILNQKKYIGKTEQSIEKRFKEHCSDAFKERNEKRPLYAAMRKYGIENFQIELIEETDNPNEREIFWIEQKRTFKNGYNATMGGDGKKYLDYDLIISEYSEIQNMTKVAEKLNISVDSVRTALNSQHIQIKSGAEISKEVNSKIIKMFDKENNFIKSFASLKDASKYVVEQGLSSATDLKGVSVHIRDCANQKRKTAYKHLWIWND